MSHREKIKNSLRELTGDVKAKFNHSDEGTTGSSIPAKIGRDGDSSEGDPGVPLPTRVPVVEFGNSSDVEDHSDPLSKLTQTAPEIEFDNRIVASTEQMTSTLRALEPTSGGMQTRRIKSNTFSSAEKAASGQMALELTGEALNRKRLKMLATGLVESAVDALKLGPLQDVRDMLQGFADAYQLEGTVQKEYEKLLQRFQMLLEVIESHSDGGISPAMESKMQGIRELIEEELKTVANKKSAKQHGQLRMAKDDEARFISSCGRIQEHMERLSLGTSLSMWKMEEQQAKDKISSLIGHLPSSPSAWYNSNAGAELRRRGCTPGTRLNVLAHLLAWASSSNAGGPCWLNGMASTGKTTIAYSICKELAARRSLAASFFCSRLREECRNVNLIIPSIAYQLAQLSPAFQSTLSKILEKDRDAHHKVLEEQFEALIKRPLLAVLDDRTLDTGDLVVVIDALDECENKDSTRTMLKVLLNKTADLPIRFIVSSRPETQIRDQMANNRVGSRLVLHELDTGEVQTDIMTYLREELKPMRLSPEEFELRIGLLVEKAGILFIYAATAVRYIGYDNFQRNPTSRLHTILNGAQGRKTAGNKEIDRLYTTILDAAYGDEELEEDDRVDMQQVLNTVICAREPLTTTGISELLGLKDTERVRAALRPLWSVLHVVGTTELVTTLHASFPDFMLEPARSKAYHCNSNDHHHKFAGLCLDFIVMTQLQFNICGLASSYLSDKQVADIETRVANAIPSELLYACRYWADHVRAANCASSVVTRLESFLSTRLLLWMEVLSASNQMKAGIECVKLTSEWCKEFEGKRELAELAELAYDAKRFVEAFSLNPVSQSTPHLYVSMLVFWPKSAPITKHYAKYAQGPTEADGTALDRRQLAHLSTWFFEGDIRRIAVSPDGLQISLAIGRDVLVVDSSSGRVILGPMKGPTDWIKALAFTPDGSRVFLGSIDGENVTVLGSWDARTGDAVLGPLELHWQDHTKSTKCLNFSLDCSRIATGTYNGIVRLWDAPTGEMLLQLDAQGQIGAVVFSLDGTRVAAGFGETLQIWDSQSGDTIVGPVTESGNMVLGPLEAHTGFVSAVPFSPDGSRIISSCEDGLVCTWDAQQDNLTPSFANTPSDPIMCVKLSSDGAHFVSGSTEGTICVWGARTGEMTLGPIKVHTSQINTVDFKNDRIVLGSKDGKICVCDATGKVILGPLDVGLLDIRAVTYSPDGTLIATGSWDRVDVWNAQDGSRVLGPLTNLRGDASSVQFSPDGTRIVVGFWGRSSNLVVWDASNGRDVFGSLDGHRDSVRSASYSPNGALIASGSHDKTIILWDAYTGKKAIGPLTEHSGWVLSVSFSPDSTRLVSGSYDRTIRIWDVQAGEMMFELQHGHEDWIKSVEYSPDGTRIMSCSGGKTVRVHDARSPEERARSRPESEFGDWTMNKDGWVIDDKSRLLVWVPADLRKGLMWPRTQAVAPQGYVRVKFDKSHMGELWAQGYMSQL